MDSASYYKLNNHIKLLIYCLPNLLIAVSEFDEEPNQNLFEIGPFYDPKFVKMTGNEDYQKEFEIEYGAYDNRKSVKLKVNINELKMK